MKQKFLKTMLLLSALVVGNSSVWADETYTIGWGTASGSAGTYTNFTTTSGTVSGILSFSTAKNSASNNPAYNSNSNELRLYYNSGGDGGSITLTPASDITITGFVMTTSTSPGVKYKVDGGSATSVTASSNTYTVSGISATSSLEIQNTNTSNTQLRIKTIQITYTVAAPAFTITAQSNNVSYGTVSLSGSVITGSPNSGYRYASPAYSVTSGSATVSQEDNEFTVSPTSDCTVQINFEPIPTYTATFSVNGATTTRDYAEDDDITFPVVTALCGLSFIGWTTTPIVGTVSEQPAGIMTSAKMGNEDITYYAVFSNSVDILTASLIGILGNSYKDFTNKTSSSGAVYAGNCMGYFETYDDDNFIQLRSKNSNSGVVTTNSGGNAKKVVVDWYSDTSDGRTLNVYGKNTAYSDATDLYGDDAGDLLGTIVKGTSTELTITGDYEYIGFRSASSAMYLTSVAITWEKAESAYCTSVSVPTVSATLNRFGYATVASSFALDFSDYATADYSAWEITDANSTSGDITFSKITGTVAAGTGVLLKGTASTTVNIPVAASGTDISGINKLEGTITPILVEVGKYYGLKDDEFVPVATSVVPAGKAILPADVVGAVKAFNFVFEDDADGIQTLSDSPLKGENIYNLAGQRLQKMQKGINIVNGKKVLK